MTGELERFYQEVVLSYDGDECLAWPYSKGTYGYGTMTVKGRRMGVHRRLCEDVNGPPPGPGYDAAHSCGRGHLACVTKRHLDWKTRKENCADMLIHGTRVRGDMGGRAKLTWKQVREIRQIGSAMKQADIGAIYGVGYRTIGRILSGQIWTES